jgi:hypothetical protein
MDAFKHIVLTIRDREENKTLGGRAAEAKVETTVWMLDEEDDDVLFNQARKLIEQESYIDALAVYVLALADSGKIRKAQATRKSALAEYSSTRHATLFEATDP